VGLDSETGEGIQPISRLVFLWVGARGVEFDWRYIQKSFEANISLLHCITLAALVWMWTKVIII
jgi:hypothetical protein